MTVTRREQKERTRRAILDASLALTADAPLAALSLRAVAKEVGIVPTAFYRHFSSIEALGLELVSESFTSLRRMLREVRIGAPGFADLIDDSLAVLVQHVHDNEPYYGFIVRERVAGTPLVREAIAREIDLVNRELATDIARIPGTDAFSPEDLALITDLIVSFVVFTAERMVGGEPVEELIVRTRRQLRMLLVGALNWRSRGQG